MPADPKTRSRLAAQVREQLFEMLGAECAMCGASECPLEINHIYRTKTYKSSSLSHYNRQRRYLREAQEGLLNVLCSDCNAIYRPLPLPVVDLSNQPF